MAVQRGGHKRNPVKNILTIADIGNSEKVKNIVASHFNMSFEEASKQPDLEAILANFNAFQKSFPPVVKDPVGFIEETQGITPRMRAVVERFLEFTLAEEYSREIYEPFITVFLAEVSGHGVVFDETASTPLLASFVGYFNYFFLQQADEAHATKLRNIADSAVEILFCWTVPETQTVSLDINISTLFLVIDTHYKKASNSLPQEDASSGYKAEEKQPLQEVFKPQQFGNPVKPEHIIQSIEDKFVKDMTLLMGIKEGEKNAYKDAGLSFNIVALMNTRFERHVGSDIGLELQNKVSETFKLFNELVKTEDISGNMPSIIKTCDGDLFNECFQEENANTVYKLHAIISCAKNFGQTMSMYPKLVDVNNFARFLIGIKKEVETTLPDIKLDTVVFANMFSFTDYIILMSQYYAIYSIVVKHKLPNLTANSVNQEETIEGCFVSALIAIITLSLTVNSASIYVDPTLGESQQELILSNVSNIIVKQMNVFKNQDAEVETAKIQSDNQPSLKENTIMTAQTTTASSAVAAAAQVDHSNDALARMWQDQQASIEVRNKAVDDAFKNVIVLHENNKKAVTETRELLDKVIDRVARVETKVYSREDLAILERIKAEASEVSGKTVYVSKAHDFTTAETIALGGVAVVAVGAIGFTAYTLWNSQDQA